MTSLHNILYLFSRKNRRKVSMHMFAIVSLAGCIFLVTTIIFALPHHSPKETSVTLLQTIGKTIELPDETPTIATVTDPSKLSEQQFFINAKTGDKVIIYVHAGKAILYRPRTQQIIGMAPLSDQ